MKTTMKKKMTTKAHRLGPEDPLPSPAEQGQPLPRHGLDIQDRCQGPQTCHLAVRSAAGANPDLRLHLPLLLLLGQQRVEPMRLAQRALEPPRLAQLTLEPPRLAQQALHQLSSGHLEPKEGNRLGMVERELVVEWL